MHELTNGFTNRFHHQSSPYVSNSRAFADEKKRLEARIAELEDELDEEQNNSEIFAEKARKNGLQVSML